jgi:hypothetical protein
VIEMGGMDAEEAATFLESSIVRKQHLFQRKEMITELLQELACLRLAIAQAAAYLNRNPQPLSKSILKNYDILSRI